MKVAAALAALVLGAGSLVPGAAEAPGAWVVVQRDGARLTFEAPPRQQGRRLVGRLAGSGTLVSVPAGEVDPEATRRANEPGEPAAAPARPAPTPRPFEAPPLGDRVRLVRPKEEAQAILEGARKGTPSPARTATAAAETVEVPEPTDRLGRGEGYWRERADERRAALEEAEAERTAAEAELAVAERAWLGASDAERTTFVLQLLAARERAERARAIHRRAEERWESLGEEARKAGAFPGWLR